MPTPQFEAAVAAIRKQKQNFAKAEYLFDQSTIENVQQGSANEAMRILLESELSDEETMELANYLSSFKDVQ